MIQLVKPTLIQLIMYWLEKKLDGNYTRMVRAILNKSWGQHPTKHKLYGDDDREKWWERVRDVGASGNDMMMMMICIYINILVKWFKGRFINLYLV